MQSKVNYLLFYKGHGPTYVALLVYVDGIVIIGSLLHNITLVKDLLSVEFKLQDSGDLKHFMDLEIARSAKGIIFSQRKYAPDLIQDIGMLAAKPTH